MANLINSGILPLVFVDEKDYDGIDPGDRLVIEDARAQVAAGGLVTVRNETKGTAIPARLELSQRLTGVMLAGGLLNYTRARSG